MAREILSGFGPERTTGPASPPGGITSTRDVMNYATPQGPMGIMGNARPGLGGDNCGNAGTQNSTSCNAGRSGSPGLHGTNRGNSGSQRG